MTPDIDMKIVRLLEAETREMWFASIKGKPTFLEEVAVAIRDMLEVELQAAAQGLFRLAQRAGTACQAIFDSLSRQEQVHVLARATVAM